MLFYESDNNQFLFCFIIAYLQLDQYVYENKCASLLCMQIVIATPGRLIEILKQKAVQLDNIKVVVVDEVWFCSAVQVEALFQLLYFHLFSF